ncbi:MAG TPA: class I SAM-dependent methyltransferase [Pyrinomonadaceae bacterium]|nr:class I SAM-dependent methyltransferase [Pyrinomonadaceae bacterium]
MSYAVSKEASSPDFHSLKLLDDVARLIEPHSPGEWLSVFRDYVRNHSKRIAFDVDFVRRYAAKGDKLLEFGSVPLLFTGALQRLGYDIQGVDIAPERFQTAIDQLGISVSKCNIETEPLPFADASFDLAIFNELFEHLRINPIFTMREVLRVLRPGGILLLSTPNLRSLGGIRNFLLRNKSYSCCGDMYGEYEKLRTIGHMGHVREYTTLEVSEFLGKIGFKVTEVIYRGGYESQLAQLATGLIPQLRPFVTIVAMKR